MTSEDKLSGPAAAKAISEKIAALEKWKRETLANVRKLIKEALPEVEEEVKWRGTPVWSLNGGICTGETYKTVVKLTFFKGASLEDPSGLFNSSLEGNVRRAIDISEGEKLDAKAFKALIKEAAALNKTSKKTQKSK